MRHQWTPEMDDLLRNLFLQMSPESVAETMNAQLGTSLTVHAIRKRAGKLLLTYHVPPGYYTLPELMMMYDCPHKTLHARVTRGTIKTTRIGNRLLVPSRELAKLDAWYLKKAPWPAYTMAEACDLLSCASSNIRTLIKKGRLTAVKLGRDWVIRREDIDKGIAYLKRTGSDQVPWKKLKAG